MPTSATVRFSLMAFDYTPRAFSARVPASYRYAADYRFSTGRGLQGRLQFRHKQRRVFQMRSRNSESMGWGLRIGIGAGVLVLIGIIGLAIYGGRVQPVTHPVDQIIANDRLPN